MEKEEIIKILKLKKGENYIIVVNKSCFPREELARIDLKKEFGVNNYFFMIVEGDVRKAVKQLKVELTK